MLKDNYRAAVLNYAASLERYYEFYVELVCRFNNELKEFKWREVKKKSGAQLQLFKNEYLKNEGRYPYLLTNELRYFRNRVVYEGHFPNYNDTRRFGEEVFKLIKGDLDILDKKYGNVINQIIIEHNTQKVKKVPDGVSISTMAIDTGISLSHSHNWNNMTFDKVIDTVSCYLTIGNDSSAIMAIINLLRGDILLEECKTLFLKILNELSYYKFLFYFFGVLTHL